MDLNKWIEGNRPAEDLCWRGAALAQFEMFASLAREATGIGVVATHRSKSIVLPVVVLHFANGASVQIRDNFYDYKVTVDAPRPVSLPDGVRGDEQISRCYCEGFPDGTVLGAHVKNPRRFTVEVAREESLRALCRAAAEV